MTGASATCPPACFRPDREDPNGQDQISPAPRPRDHPAARRRDQVPRRHRDPGDVLAASDRDAEALRGASERRLSSF